MYWPDGLRTKRLTSSVTAAMRSPKVVLITFCWCMIFFSARSNGYIFGLELVDIDVAPFGLVYGQTAGRKLYARKMNVPNPT